MKKLALSVLAGSLMVAGCQAQAKDYSEDAKKIALFWYGVNCSEEYGKLLAKYSPGIYTYDEETKKVYRVQDAETTRLILNDEKEFKKLLKQCEYIKNPRKYKGLEFNGVTVKKERVKGATVWMVFVKYKKKGGPDKTVAMQRIDFAILDNPKAPPRIITFKGYNLWDVE